jgi:hypothetical protein
VALALAALLLGASAPMGAECPAGPFRYAPAYVGPFSAYGHPAAFEDPFDGSRVMKATTAKICSDCAEPRRGVRLAARKEAAVGVFQAPVTLDQGFCVEGLLDVSGTKATAAILALEIDSPAVAPDGVPELYALAGVRDEAGDRRVFVEVSGTAVGTTLFVPPEAESVALELHYFGGEVDVNARVVPNGSLTTLVANQAFPWAGSATVTASAVELAKGDRAGFALAVTGNVHGGALRAALLELSALVALQEAALADLDGAQTADARAKLEAARLRLVERGPAIPGSDPPAFEPPLVDLVGALPATKATRSAVKRLGKAARQAERARDQLDLAKPDAAPKARALAEKALAAKRAAKQILETGVPAEG